MNLLELTIKNNTINAESGVMLGRLVKEAIKNKLTGLESLVGVPGTLGGALMMNAGAWGAEISNYLVSVNVINSKGEIYIQEHQVMYQKRFQNFQIIK